MRSARKRTHFMGLVVALTTMMGCANAWTGSLPPSAAPSASPSPVSKKVVKGQASTMTFKIEPLESTTDFTGSGKGLADWYYGKFPKADADKVASAALPPNSYQTSPQPTDGGSNVVIKICVAREPKVCPSPGSGADRPWPATPTPSVVASAAASATPAPQNDNKQGEWVIPSPTPSPSPTPTPIPLGEVTFDATPSPAAK